MGGAAQHGCRIVAQEGAGFRGGFQYFPARQNPAPARRQTSLFAGQRGQAFQRLQLSLQFLPRQQVPRQSFASRRRGLLRADPRLPRAGHRSGETVVAGEPVEQVAMRSFVQQAPLLELAVDLDQFPAQSPEKAGGNRNIVDEGAGASVLPERPPQNQFLVRIDFQVPKRRPRFPPGCIEAGGNIGPFRTGPDKPAIGPRAQSQAQRIEQDRLARAGLAGKHGKTRPEGQVQPFDQYHIADSKPAEHGGRALSLGGRRRRLGRRLGRSATPPGALLL